jgi:hypothetical protein
MFALVPLTSMGTDKCLPHGGVRCDTWGWGGLPKPAAFAEGGEQTTLGLWCSRQLSPFAGAMVGLVSCSVSEMPQRPATKGSRERCQRLRHSAGQHVPIWPCHQDAAELRLSSCMY